MMFEETCTPQGHDMTPPPIDPLPMPPADQRWLKERLLEKHTGQRRVGPAALGDSPCEVD